MARKPMVTRTITTTNVIAMTVNVQEGETHTESFTLPRTYSDEAKLLKALKSQHETEEVKIVAILSKEESETLYGMDEHDFIAHAVKLDPTTRKAE